MMDRQVPPGTIRLMERQNAAETSKIVLMLPPSDATNDPPIIILQNWNKWRKDFNFLLVLATALASFTFGNQATDLTAYVMAQGILKSEKQVDPTDSSYLSRRVVSEQLLHSLLVFNDAWHQIDQARGMKT
ncbi:hypothetical protein QL093DRAFT_2078165 [Fusarium oxysporum]|nr:hypothetical protein QL093DRAFT_2078165 [Fusarium oxysporum]